MLHISNTHARNTFSIALSLSKALVRSLERVTQTSKFVLLGFSLIVASTFGVQSVALADDLIDVNIASASMLAEGLPNIGPAKAQAIVDYRTLNGNFQTVDGLTNVKGIGESTLEKIRHLLMVGSVGTPAAVPATKATPSTPSASSEGVASSETATKRAVNSVVSEARN